MAPRDPKRSLRHLARRLWREHASPARLGLAVGLGVVIGCSPFFGLHLPLGLGLALLLRLNKVAVFLGSQISIPPLAPLLGFASVQVGARLLSGAWLHLGAADFALTRLPGLVRTFFLSWLLGGLLVGVALGLPVGLLTGLVIRWRRRCAASPEAAAREAAWREAGRAALARYAGASRGHRGYLASKLRMDPVYRQVCEGLGLAETVVDLGTGLALLPVLLATRGQAARVLGVEWDGKKVASARGACAGLGSVELIEADARAHPLPPTDAILLVDLLHYYPLVEQHTLLERAAAALRPGGRLVIRETDRRAPSLLTRAIEGLAVRLGWNKGPGLSFRTAGELAAELEGLGLRCRLEQASSWLHRGNFLLWAERPALAAAEA